MRDRRLRLFLLAGLAVTALLAGVASFYASSQPDGLERVARDTGIDETATAHAAGDSPLADYSVSGVEDSRLSGGLAGLVGVGLTVVVAGGLFLGLRAMRTRRRPADEPVPPAGAAAGR